MCKSCSCESSQGGDSGDGILKVVRIQNGEGIDIDNEICSHLEPIDTTVGWGMQNMHVNTNNDYDRIFPKH